MSLSQLEKIIWRATQEQLKNPKLKLKDLYAWSTGKLDPPLDDEEQHEVKIAGYGTFFVCVPKGANRA